MAAEREAALGIESSATGKRKGKKSAVNAGLNGNGNGNGTAASTAQPSRAGTDELVDGDTTMASVGDVTAETIDKEVEAAEALAKRKRSLPTCECRSEQAL